MSTPNTRDEEVRSVIMQLSELADLIALRNYVAERTRYGRKPGPTPWHWTRRYMDGYSDPERPTSADELIARFEAVGCSDEIAATRFIITHD